MHGPGSAISSGFPVWNVTEIVSPILNYSIWQYSKALYLTFGTHTCHLSYGGYVIIEWLIITLTSNGKRESVPRDQISPLLVITVHYFNT